MKKICFVAVLLAIVFATVAYGQIFGRFRANRAVQNQCPQCVETFSAPLMQPTWLPGEPVPAPVVQTHILLSFRVTAEGPAMQNQLKSNAVPKTNLRTRTQRVEKENYPYFTECG